ncbi:MAG: hypothetical protein ACK6CP_04765 [Pseudanabaena sp.]|jgi:hypothetical protein
MTKQNQVTFFIDRSLESNKLVYALKQAGASIERHGDRFSHNTPDTDWLTDVSNRGWVILTQDKKISKNSLEVLAVAQSHARMFTLSSGNWGVDKIVTLLTNVVLELEQFADHNPAPFIAKITEAQSIVMWTDHQELLNLLS